ncbi:MAG: hypothetical protein IKL22_00545 [Lachnospiraceae bacterium]|nr:hypothetical protein [Lachnospiraceae bacterium]
MSENTNSKVMNIETVRDIEKRELNSTINSYVGNKHELLERVPELIDWNMFRRRCTPELVEVLQMQHKRLKKRGVQLKTEEKTLSRGWESGKECYLQTESRYQDGPYTIAVLKKKVKRIRKYYREKKLLSKFKDKAWFTYFVRQEPEEGKKLSSEDMAFKALGNYTRETEYQPEAYFKEHMLSSTLTIPCAIMISSAGGLRYMLGGAMSKWFPFLQGDIAAIAPTLIVAGMECALAVSILKLWRNWKRRCKSHKVLQSIRKQWQDFSVEQFVSMADSRLKRIFYADSMADVGDFISCDLSEFLKKYANVVDCETMDFWFMGISQDENYEYIDVRQKVLLTGDLGNRMKRKKLTVKIRYMRSKDSIMYTDFYRDWYIGEVEV